MAFEVSVVISTRNRYQDLEECLSSLQEQSQKPSEIIIIDQSDEDKIDRIKKSAEKHGAKYFFLSKPNSLTKSRNYGIEKAKGDLILFVDDDTILKRDYIENMTSFFNAEKNMIAATGAIINDYDTPFLLFTLKLFYKLIRSVFLLDTLNPEGFEISPVFEASSRVQKPSKAHKIDVLSGANMCIRADILKKVKFDERLKKYAFKEDVDISYRLKKYGDMWTIPGCELIHKVAETGRIGDFEVARMREAYTYYLFTKNFQPGWFGRFLFFYSRIWKLFESLAIRPLLIFTGLGKSKHFSRINYIRTLVNADYFDAIKYVLKNLKEIEESQTNDFLRIS